MTSEKKTTSNRRNAQRSTGPKTIVGKQHVRQNARKHGFYSPELHLSNEQKIELESLRRTLWTDLAPSTALQELACEEVVCCSWRCKSALNLESRGLKACADSQQGQNPTAQSCRPAMTQWYGSGRQALNDGVLFLRQLKEAIEHHGTVPEDWREGIARGFGAEFLEALTKWTPMSHDAFLFANFVADHHKTHGSLLPKAEGPPKAIADPQQGMEMMFKLIELQIQHLRDLVATLDRGIRADGVGALDFAPRFFTNASRDLHRAVAWLQYLKENDL